MLNVSHNQPSPTPIAIEPIITLPDLEPPEITPLAQVPALTSYELESPDWLWPNYIPCGSLTLLDGPRCASKTQFLVDLAARVSSGQPMPDGSTGIHGSVIFISPFDPYLRHLNPAFHLARADRSLIFPFSLTPDAPPSSWSTTPTSAHATEHPFRFDEQDLRALARLMRHTFCRLLIIDSWSATLDDTDSCSQRSIAHMLHILRTMVALDDVACILVRSSDPRARIQHLMPADKFPCLPACASTHLAILPDPLTPTHSLLVSTTQTFSAPPPIFQFHLTPHPDYPQFSHLNWDGPSDLSLDNPSLASSAPPTLGPTREHILRVLQQQPTPDPMTIPALLELLPHLSYELLRKTLQRMVRDHQLSSPRRGLYALPISPLLPPTTVPDHLSPSPVPNQMSPTTVPVPLSPDTVYNHASPTAVPVGVSPAPVPVSMSPTAVPNHVSPEAVPVPASPSPDLYTFSHAISYADMHFPEQVSPTPVPNPPSQPVTHHNIS